jgi:hypothetical protein
MLLSLFTHPIENSEAVCTSKEIITRMGEIREWEKIFSSYPPDKGLISKIYKELKNLTPKELIIQLINRQMN